MRILCLYHDVRTRGYASEIRSISGLSAGYLYVHGDIEDIDIKEQRPDMVLTSNPHVDSDTIDYIKSKNIPLVVYGNFDPLIPWTEQDDLWKPFDWIFVHHYEFTKYLRSKRSNVHYLPHGFRPDLFKYDPSIKLRIPVSYVLHLLMEPGDYFGKMLEYTDALEDFDIQFSSYLLSYGRPGWPKMIERGDVRAVPPFRKDIYASSKINLDLPFIYGHSYYDDKYDVTPNIFEAMASGGFVLTVKCEENQRLFSENTVVYFDDSILSMREAVSKYLKYDNLRRHIARSGYRVVINNHTYKHRFKEMFKIMGI